MSAPLSGEAVEVRFSDSVFTTDAIKRAAYSMADRLDVDISRAEGEIICVIKSRKAGASLEDLESEFRKEALDYDLRIQIAKETESTRNLILALAFSKTGVQG